jgi:hypothetical protein
MQFYFIDTNKQVNDAWEKVFAGVENVSIYHASLFEYPCDAIVSKPG